MTRRKFMAGISGLIACALLPKVASAKGGIVKTRPTFGLVPNESIIPLPNGKSIQISQIEAMEGGMITRRLERAPNRFKHIILIPDGTKDRVIYVL